MDSTTSRQKKAAGVVADRAEIIRAMNLLMAPDQVTELRALDATIRGERYVQTWAGYFNDWNELANSAESLSSASGVYVIINPINPDLFARAANRLKPAKKDVQTQDANIVRRRWILIDADPIRVKGISSTDPEHEAAIERAAEIWERLRGEGWPEPILADSGNGAHLLYPVDLEVGEGEVVKRMLEMLSAEFSGRGVEIDTSVHNPARLCKLYGTIAAKGDNTVIRPHRASRLIEVPQ